MDQNNKSMYGMQNNQPQYYIPIISQDKNQNT